MIALDIALFLKENDIKISPAARGVLFTLAFRMGSNPYMWISQKELAEELNISEEELKIHINSILDKNLIERFLIEGLLIEGLSNKKGETIKLHDQIRFSENVLKKIYG